MIRLAIRCRAEHADLALAQLIELAPAGIEEIRDGDVIEYAVYGPPGEIPTLPDLHAAVGDDLVEIRTTEVEDDWQERWKQFHGTVRIAGDGAREVYLRPSWEQAEAHEGAIEVVLDPGQAFGTGSHPTTRLCVELLLDLEPGGELVDLGCGSGVLAIVAAKLGWSPLRGYDFDRLAVEATEVNARDNGVTMLVEKADLRDGLPALAPTVVANLMRPLLLDVASQIPRDAHGIESIILSGLLDEEADEISAAYAALGGGLAERRRVSDGGWTGLLLTAV